MTDSKGDSDSDHLDNALQMIFGQSDLAKVEGSNYLVRASVEVIADLLKQQTMLYLDKHSFSKDKHLNQVRMVFSDRENYVFTYDANQETFYIQDKNTSEKWTESVFAGDAYEASRVELSKYMLMCIAGKMDSKEFYSHVLAAHVH